MLLWTPKQGQQSHLLSVGAACTQLWAHRPCSHPCGTVELSCRTSPGRDTQLEYTWEWTQLNWEVGSLLPFSEGILDLFCGWRNLGSINIYSCSWMDDIDWNHPLRDIDRKKRNTRVMFSGGAVSAVLLGMWIVTVLWEVWLCLLGLWLQSDDRILCAHLAAITPHKSIKWNQLGISLCSLRLF